MRKIFLTVAVLSLLLTACGQTIPAPATNDQPADTEVDATETSVAPTNTPEPTATPKPTRTPRPTSTPVPTKDPDPVIVTGNGGDVVDAENPYDVAIVHITGNSAGRHFSVKNYGEDNEEYDLLVNTTDPYDGYRLLDSMEDEHTVRFQIEGQGEWTIEIFPLYEGNEIGVPGTYQGNGDDVLIIRGQEPDTAKIVGNADGRYFGVFAYTKNERDLLINTTDPYDGKVLLPPGTLLIEVKAKGDWYIETFAK